MATQAREDCLAELDTKPQSKLNAFEGFTNSITSLAMNRISQKSSITTAELLGLTSEDMLQSLQLQEDNDLRNSLQKSVGSIKDYKLKSDDGTEQSINNLRCKRRNNETVPSLKTNTFKIFTNSNVVTPNASKNKRWYNNKLSATPIDMVSDITNETRSEMEEDKTVIMQKKVMKRLLSTDSPPSRKKRICFRKMVNDDKEARTIISLSVEMNASVDAAKDMVINNCSEE